MKKEPIRHHYIPQFILRNFSCDDRGRVWYYDKKKKVDSLVEPREIFMEKNLYRDEINYDSEPTQIEHDLAVYENEVSRILKEKFLSGRDIIITEEEDAKLKLFFAIMGVRAKTTFDLFGKQLTISSKNFYKYYQKNNNFLNILSLRPNPPPPIETNTVKSFSSIPSCFRASSLEINLICGYCFLTISANQSETTQVSLQFNFC